MKKKQGEEEIRASFQNHNQQKMFSIHKSLRVMIEIMNKKKNKKLF